MLISGLETLTTFKSCIIIVLGGQKPSLKITRPQTKKNSSFKESNNFNFKFAHFDHSNYRRFSD